MKPYQHKKQFGQHFLKDAEVISQTIQLLKERYPTGKVLEVGPGMGVLTEQLVKEKNYTLFINEIDRDLLPVLIQTFHQIPQSQWLPGDFLQISLAALGDHYALIGNFPYNISTQIVFRMLEERMHIPVAVGMFQKEVGERLAAPPGSKTYGITSVLTQAYYQVKLHIHIPPSSFQPPPKVDSVVLSMERLPEETWPICGFEPLRKVVKAAFGQRRKTLRNALKGITFQGMAPDDPIWDLRAERLSVQDFTRLALAQMKT